MSNTSLAQPTCTVPERSTRHHRVDYEFLGLLNEDFGIDFFSLNQAFMGVPATPKKQAIALCESDLAFKSLTPACTERGRYDPIAYTLFGRFLCGSWAKQS